MKKASFTMRPVSEILERRGLEPGGRVQKCIDNDVLRLSSPYLPHATGMLEKRGRMSTEIGSGEVNYASPYGRFLYYEKVMVGEKSRSAWARPNEKKVVTDKNIQYRGGGLRGGRWFERMKADHKDEILRNAARTSGGEAKK